MLDNTTSFLQWYSAWALFVLFFNINYDNKTAKRVFPQKSGFPWLHIFVSSLTLLNFWFSQDFLIAKYIYIFLWSKYMCIVSVSEKYLQKQDKPRIVSQTKDCITNHFLQ